MTTELANLDIEQVLIEADSFDVEKAIAEEARQAGFVPVNPKPAWAVEREVQAKRVPLQGPRNPQARNNDVSLSHREQAGKPNPMRAEELSETSIYFIAEWAARCEATNGLEAADYVKMAFKFEPSEADRRYIRDFISSRTDWHEALKLARMGWVAWFTERYGYPPAPFKKWVPPGRAKHHTSD